MDPLSISAGIIALLQLSSTVIGYLSDVKGGPKELQKIRLELCSVLPMLSILQVQAEQAKAGGLWSSTLLSLDEQNGPIQQFREALERLKLTLAPVEGWKKVGKTFTWPFEKDEIQKILNTIERQKLLFTFARQNDHIGLSKAIKGDIEDVHKRVNKIGEGVTKLQISEKHDKVRLWLAGPDPSSNYNRALSKRHKGTGSWLLENAVFRDWKQDSGPGSVIWLYGIPGCGKTILCSTILEHVLNNYAQMSNIAVLYFFFDFNDNDKQQHEGMIRSLLSQLSMHCASVSPELETLYSSCMNGGRKPTFEALLETLHQMTTAFENTFIVLDALDECKERPELLADIERLVSWEDTDLRILATSRREKNISALVNADIRAYVHDQLQTNKKLQRWQNKLEVQMEIEETLMKKANGMFRWAACQLDSLGICLTLPKLRKALAALPSTLNDTYARILCNIDPDYQQNALHLLQWLTFSVRPLHLEEIAEVVAVDINDTPQFDPERRLPDPRDVLEICSSLITVTPWWPSDAKSETRYSGSSASSVSLAHFSVKEYLTSDIIRHGQVAKYRLQEIDCHETLAKDCLAYLFHFDGISAPRSQVFVKYPLARYVVENWTQHARVAEKRDNTLCRGFFLTKGEAFNNWIRLRDPERRFLSSMARPRKDIASSLYYASGAGLLESVKMLLGKGADINAPGGEFGSSLIFALTGGYTEIVQLLLEKGADINAQDAVYGNALTAASTKGYTEIVQLLLKKGANINAQDAVYGNALTAASTKGYTEIVQLLLEKGADINAQDAVYENALTAASTKGYIEIVQLLLEKGADINAQGALYGNALTKASSGGHIEIVQLLLDNGADLNARSESRHDDALLVAIGKGDEVLAQLLIENGADVTGRDSPLAKASYHGLQRVVELVLDKNIHVDIQDEYYSRALAAATRGGQRKMVQILLDKGVVINAQVMNDALDGGKIALRQTLRRRGGEPQILQMLLNRGGNPDVQDAQGRALCHRASADSITNLKLLVESGANLTVTDKQGRTCLHHAVASKRVNSNAATRLLNEGFDPNLPDRDGWTSLHWAAKVGDAETIKILEDAGAKFSIENIMGWTPDDVAAYHHHKTLWKTSTALDCGVERSKPTLKDRTSTASPKADARGLAGPIFPGELEHGKYCDGCDLVSRNLRASITICTD
ncbi:MAG: hypothetical protein Q9175_005728 [Cornicularia normoerica]